ncbi:hypothetical protein [Kitasatospora sp. NPDC087314]|uniref:hypothetical protein n=1 Tax=Kitasatospora sp. NPDC087314 TaxID=3364068 RepID=UPI00382CFC44
MELYVAPSRRLPVAVAWDPEYPQARLVALAECGTHAVFGAVVGALSAGEQALSHVCRQGGHGVSEGDDVLVTERRHLGDGSTRGRRKRFRKLGRSGD